MFGHPTGLGGNTIEVNTDAQYNYPLTPDTGNIPYDQLVNQSPCGAFDWVYTSDACLNWLGQNNPSDPRYVGATKGLLYLGSQTAGSAATQAVNEVVAGIGSGIANAASQAPVTTGISITLLVVAGLAALVLAKAI